MSILIRVFTKLYWNALFCACLFKIRGFLIYGHAHIAQCPVYSRKSGVKLYRFKQHLRQFIATTCEYLLGVMHLLSMLHTSCEFTPAFAVEQVDDRGSCELKELAVGHSWWVVVPRLPPRPQAKCSMAADDTISLAFLSPAPAGQFLSLGGAVKIKSKNNVIFFNAILFTLPLCFHQSYPGSPASLRPWFSLNPVQSVALNSYLSNRKWNWKETRPPGKSWWKLLLMG